MADDQTRLLQEIRDALKEQTTLTKQFREETMVVQKIALDRQRSAIRMQRLAIFVLVLVAVVAFLVFSANH